MPGARNPIDLRRALANGTFPLSPQPAGLALIAHPTRSDHWLAPFDAHLVSEGGYEHSFAAGFSRLLTLSDTDFFEARIGGTAPPACKIPPELKRTPTARLRFRLTQIS